MKSAKGFVITGASSGIGREIAVALARRYGRARFFLVGRSRESLADTTEKLRQGGAGDVWLERIDLESVTPGESDELAQMVREGCDELSGVVHCAGRFERSDVPAGGHAGPALKLISLNLIGPMMLDAALVPLLASQKRGTLLYVNSTAAIEHRPGNEAYSASKAGLLAYANALRESLRPHRVGVITACPGPTWTRSWEGFEEQRSRMMSAQSIGEALAHQLAMSLSGEPVCEQIHLRDLSGAI